MGVEYVKELWDGRSGSDGIERNRNYTRRFEVKTNRTADDATVAGGPQARALGLPGNGDPHPIDAYSLMVRITADQHSDDPRLWYVTCNYDSKLPAGQAAEQQTFNPETGQSETNQSPTKADRADNPLDRPATWKVSYETQMEICKFDRHGSPIFTSSDEPYDPPLEQENPYAVISITKNYAIVHFDWLDQFMGAVNFGGNPAKPKRWFGRAPRTCRIMGISYESGFENGVSFWPVTFTIKVRPQTWDRFALEASHYQKREQSDGSWKKKPTFTEVGPDGRPQLLDGRRVGVEPMLTWVNGQEIKVVTMDPENPSAPRPVVTGKNGRGQQLPKADPDDLLNAPSPVFTRWRTCKEIDFGLLKLGV